jgi:uncharacterized protein
MMTDQTQTGFLRLSGWLHRYRYGMVALLTAVGLVLSSVVGAALAQTGYPAFQDPYVNDYGAVLAPENEVQVRDRLDQFRAETGVHVVLLTVNSISDYGTGDSTIESFATNLFNTWGIGDATRNDGILVLVAPGDRKVRIELGAGYDRRADQTAQSIIDRTMLPKFRDGLMAAGTMAGVDAVINRFNPDTPAPLRAIAPVRDAIAGITGTSEGLIAFMLAPLIPLGIGLKIGLGWWNRNRSRQCPSCTTEMRRLSEQEDDRYLEPGERREESLKSVDYDVWLCPSCGYHTTLSYNSFASGYRTCSQCSHKTLAETARTLVSPTYTSSGTAEVTQDCKHCGYHHTYTRTIPRKQRSSSSSSSSGSGGGGRSSGGGASGSW